VTYAEAGAHAERDRVPLVAALFYRFLMRAARAL